MVTARRFLALAVGTACIVPLTVNAQVIFRNPNAQMPAAARGMGGGMQPAGQMGVAGNNFAGIPGTGFFGAALANSFPTGMNMPVGAGMGGFGNGMAPAGGMGGFGNGMAPVGGMGGFGNGMSPVGGMGGLGNGMAPVGGMGGLGNGMAPVGGMGGFGNGMSPAGGMGGIGNGVAPGVLGPLFPGAAPYAAAGYNNPVNSAALFNSPGGAGLAARALSGMYGYGYNPYLGGMNSPLANPLVGGMYNPYLAGMNSPLNNPFLGGGLGGFGGANPGFAMPAGAGR